MAGNSAVSPSIQIFRRFDGTFCRERGDAPDNHVNDESPGRRASIQSDIVRMSILFELSSFERLGVNDA
jgi:hypothetical protein